MADAISIGNVRKTFGPKVAVDDVSLRVAEGSLCGLIGPNGAGKTTTIRLIMSIIFADRGEISVLGKASAIESKDRIGYLPEEKGTYRKMKVGAFLIYMGRLKGVDGAGLDRKVRDWLDRVDLKDTYKKKCEELSKGMQQKVQFIASVLHEPDLIILDEPFSGLDPVNRVQLRGLIDEQHRKGRTIIFSTHAMYEAEQLCDHLLMFNNGKKVLDLSMTQLRRDFDPRTILVEPMEGETVSRHELSGVAGIVETIEVGSVFELKLANLADSAKALAEICTKYRVRRIELKRPSVEEIFIDIVSSNSSAEELVQLRSSLAQARLDAEGVKDSA